MKKYDESIPADLERLIVRRLDAELGPEEQLRLQREILRNPPAREMLDNYQQIDSLAAGALNDALGGLTGLNFDSLAVQRGMNPVRSYSRAWWLLPAAMAAALGIVFLGRTTVPTERGAKSTEILAGNALTGAESHAKSAAFEHGNHIRPPSGPRQIRRDTQRDLLGVMGPDGNIYWLEVDHTRTIDRPDTSYGVRLAKGDL